MSHWCIRAFLAFAAFLLVSCSSAPASADIAALKLQGETLMAWVERYAGQHNGVYPSSLEAAGIETPKTRWGSWEYSVTRDDKIIVRVGHYLRDGFTLSWQPGYGWYLDT